jgi:hypothetical protein
MSVRIMSAIWERAPYDGGTLIVLLALGDYCNDEGECFPNICSIARKARLGERQVHNILRDLKNDGVISIQKGGGRGVSNRYRIHTETLNSVSVKPDSVKPISVKSTTETLQSSSRNPAICNNAIRKNRQEPSRRSVHHPTLEDVTAYCRERRNQVNPQRWFDHYSSNGWRVGKNSMKDWKAAVRTWEQNGANYGNGNGNGNRQAGLLANRDAARQGIMARRSVDRAG